MSLGSGSMDEPARGSDLHGSRDALTRVLAIEGRNALARVELAASELGRFDVAPFALDRIETIHDAVSQIDALLAKIDVLASPRPPVRCPGVDVAVVAGRVLERLRSTLEARGVEVEALDRAMMAPGLLVTCPEPVVEAMLCGLLRFVLASFESVEMLRFIVSPESESVAFGFELPTSSGVSALDRGGPESRIELDVQLAEWNGGFVAEWPDRTGDGSTRGGTTRVGIRLPAAPTGDRVGDR